MAFVVMCPYWKKNKGKTELYCEGARFRFPDNAARRDILYGFCAHPDAWKKCMIRRALDKYYYERKFKVEVEK